MTGCATTKSSRYADLYLTNKPKQSSLLSELDQYAKTEKKIDMSQFKTVEKDIAYAGTTNPAQGLDIIYPSVGEAPYKVIIAIHGGAWLWGNKESEMLAPVMYATTQGYAVVSVNYRLSGEAMWPAPLYDVKAAVRFIRTNAEKYHLDATKIVVWGGSAGGHLAEMLGATNDRYEFENFGMGSPSKSSAVQGVVSWYGVSDVTDFPKLKEPINKEMGFNTELPEFKDRAEKASPLHLVTDKFPPILLVHGTNDQVVPYRQSLKLFEEINRVCGPDRAILKTFDGAAHGDAIIHSWDSVMDNLNFIDKILWPDGVNPNRNNNKIVIKLL